MSPVRSVNRPRRGAAAVELAMLSPILVAMLLGIWEVGRMVETQQLLSNAAREGARQASTGTLTNDQVEDVVRTYLTAANVNVANLNVTVANLTNPALDSRDALQLDHLRVTVVIPFADVQWVAFGYVATPTSILTAESDWFSLKDKDFPSPSDPPIE